MVQRLDPNGGHGQRGNLGDNARHENCLYLRCLLTDFEKVECCVTSVADVVSDEFRLSEASPVNFSHFLWWWQQTVSTVLERSPVSLTWCLNGLASV